jgi:hypothetical protein
MELGSPPPSPPPPSTPPSPPPPTPPPPSAPPPNCEESPTAVAKRELNEGTVFLDFDKAALKHSNLGGKGPQFDKPHTIRYTGLATLLDGTIVDLEISAESEYEPKRNERNGYDEQWVDGGGEKFGNINFRSPMNKNTGEYVDFKYTFKKAGTEEEVVLPRAFLTFYDFDMDGNEGIRECIQFRGITDVLLSDQMEADYPSELKSIAITHDFSGLRGENTKPEETKLLEQVLEQPVFPGGFSLTGWESSHTGVTRMYCADTPGVGDDNPRRSRSLTGKQKARRIMVSIQQASSFELRYVLSIGAIRPCEEGSSHHLFTKQCRKAQDGPSGRNFLFAGDSSELNICAPPSPPPPDQNNVDAVPAVCNANPQNLNNDCFNWAKWKKGEAEATRICKNEASDPGLSWAFERCQKLCCRLWEGIPL